MKIIQSNFPSSYFLKSPESGENLEKKDLAQNYCSAPDCSDDLSELVLENKNSLSIERDLKEINLSAKKNSEKKENIEAPENNGRVRVFSNKEYIKFNLLIHKKKIELRSLCYERKVLNNKFLKNLNDFINLFNHLELEVANQDNKIVLTKIKWMLYAEIKEKSSLTKVKHKILKNMKILKERGDVILGKKIDYMVFNFYKFYFPAGKFFSIDREINFRETFIHNIELNLSPRKNNNNIRLIS